MKEKNVCIAMMIHLLIALIIACVGIIIDYEIITIMAISSNFAIPGWFLLLDDEL